MAGEYESYKAAGAERYFMRVRSLSSRVSALKAEVDAQRAACDGLKGIDYGAAKGAGPNADAVADAVIRLQALIGSYCAELSQLAEEQARAHEVAAKASRPEYAAALTRYYILGKSWELVCVEMGYTYDGMMKLRRRALADAYDNLPLGWRDPVYRAI